MQNVVAQQFLSGAERISTWLRVDRRTGQPRPRERVFALAGAACGLVFTLVYWLAPATGEAAPVPHPMDENKLVFVEGPEAEPPSFPANLATPLPTPRVAAVPAAQAAPVPPVAPFARPMIRRVNLTTYARERDGGLVAITWDN